MKEADKIYCDTSKVYVQPINKTIAKSMIIKYHYTHAWTACRYSLGIYYKTDDVDIFGNSAKLIGVAVYGFPVGARAAESISDLLTKDNVLELTRLFIHDGYGSNIESYSLGQTFKWFRENDPDIKALISYADAGQEHNGTIYQATNWIYQGLSTDIALMPNYGISLTKDPYEWIHSRTVYSMWGSSNLEHLKVEIGKQGYTEFYRRIESGKHRYIQVIVGNKREKKLLNQSLKHTTKPYPKNDNTYLLDIQVCETYLPNSLNNFW